MKKTTVKSQRFSQSPKPRPWILCWAALNGFLLHWFVFWSQLNLWCLQPPVAISSSVIMHCVKWSTYWFYEAYFETLELGHNSGRIGQDPEFASGRPEQPAGPHCCPWRSDEGCSWARRHPRHCLSPHAAAIVTCLALETWKWVEPPGTLRQQYPDHVTVSGKTEADVQLMLPASACSQTQIPNAHKE